MMKKLMLTVASAALGIGMALPGYAQTLDADCQKMFDAADVNKDGSLGAGESDKFVVLMSTKPKDATIVTMEEFLAECRKDAFKSVQEAAVTPAPDTNAATKSSSDATSTTAEQPAATAEQPAATAEQPATTAEQPAVTAEQPAATAEQPAATAEQPAATAEQPAATAEQPAATAEQPAATAEQPAATAAQPAATAEQPAATAEQPAATAEQPAATAEQPAVTAEQPAPTPEAVTADASAAPADMLASKLIGTTVMSVDNKNIGEINDIIIDIESEQAAQAIIGVGGFLGIGEKNVAVDLKRLNVRTDVNSDAWTIVLDTTEDELKQLPEYKAAAK